MPLLFAGVVYWATKSILLTAIGGVYLFLFLLFSPLIFYAVELFQCVGD